jgi:hypothetical protein
MTIRTCLGMILLLGATTTVQAQAERYYRWIDDDGIVHYGDVQPFGFEYEIVKGPPPPPISPELARQRLDARVEKVTEELGQRKVDDVEGKQRAALAAARKQNCETARSNLALLQMGGKRRIIDPQGNVVPLNGDQANEMVAAARQQIAEFCDGEGTATRSPVEPVDILNR